jgi:parallel beta-helix repeat protein
MRQFFVIVLLVLAPCTLQAQREFHVFPKDDLISPGAKSGNGNLQSPWDLQTALSQSSNSVNGGDIIWLHKGVYNGRYISTLNSTRPNKKITVTSYKFDKVTLNGNVQSNKKFVLEVRGKNAIYKDLEITFLGNFSRTQIDPNFKKIGGISHSSGIDCKFINLVIHNNPGSGFGSWKRTGGSIIDGCIIYNNGYMSKKRGSGVGIYVQNESDKIRLITNNTIFNNYYKGIEVWSDNGKATSEYVKNVTLKNNVIFNNGLPSRVFRDNLIIATNDRNGINIAKNITVEGNIFYHNTKLSKTIENNNASSLTLGFNKKAPIDDIKVFNNIIIGRKDAIRILDVKSLYFKNNIVYSGYVRFRESVMEHINDKNWKFSNNTYYTRNNKPIRVQGIRDYTIAQWNSKYGLERQTIYKNYKEFNLNNVLSITKNNFKNNRYSVVLFSKDGRDITVDFSKYKIPKGSSYNIIDVENRKVVIKSGKTNKASKIVIPMILKEFEMPLHNTNSQKTLNNFGVYIVEFKEKKSFFKRIFNW